MIAAVLPAGLHFFNAHQQSTAVSWKIPWCMVILITAVTFQIDPVFSFLEGCGFVSDVARMRLAQAILGSALGWVAIASHHGLFAPAMIIVGRAFVGIGFLLTDQRRKFLLGLLFHSVGQHHVGWRREIWPFQWRIALSTLSGYFIFQIINPVLFAYRGPIAAGRMGMSLSISSSLLAVSMSWMNTKASPFGNLIARAEIEQLDRLFFRTLWQSTIMLMVSATLLFMCLMAAARVYPKLAGRVLTPWAFGLLLLTAVVNQIIFSEALYLRAHKREPFLVNSVTGAFTMCGMTWLLGRFFGADAVATGSFLLTIIIGLPWATHVFVSKRREWHGAISGNLSAECLGRRV